MQIHRHVQLRKKKRNWFTSAARWISTRSNIFWTYINISWTAPNILYQKVAEQHNWDENMRKTYEDKVYIGNININLKNVEKVEKKLK